MLNWDIIKDLERDIQYRINNNDTIVIHMSSNDINYTEHITLSPKICQLKNDEILLISDGKHGITINLKNVSYIDKDYHHQTANIKAYYIRGISTDMYIYFE